MSSLFPNQMRYQAALLPDTRRPLGFAPFERKPKGSFAATVGRTWREQAHRVPNISRTNQPALVEERA